MYNRNREKLNQKLNTTIQKINKHHEHKLKSAFSFRELSLSIILIILIIIYLIVARKIKLYIPCIFHSITGLWCPGCGLTRMLYALITGNIVQAYFYNQLLFISLPIFLILFINNIIAKIKNKKPLYQKIPNYLYWIYVFLLFIFMVLRNILPYFAPHTI